MPGVRDLTGGSAPSFEWLGALAGASAGVPPSVPSSARADVLAALGIDDRSYLTALGRASRHGSDAAAELIADETIDEAAYLAACAARLDCAVAPPEPGETVLSFEPLPVGAQPPRLLRLCGRSLAPRLVCMPLLETLDELDAALRLAGAPRIALASRAAIAAARARHDEARRLREACLGLSADRPAQSARTVLGARQAAALTLGALLAALLALHAPGPALLALHAALSLAFAATILLRLAAACEARPPPRRPAPLPPRPHAPPVYSVLVPLHREAGMVAPLASALDRLDWPRTRIDVKLICEADDAETIEAARRAAARRPHMELVLVPPAEPRTKPKALMFALPLARGSLVTVFDAEDRPHPLQLRAAHAAFAAGPPELACLQAPLAVPAPGRGWLAGLFALEYAALFRGLLPFLARRGLPLPLGGTSNHFRRAVLDAVGGWDPHNVTEDADLGIRIARAGYRIGVVDCPTDEEAPESWPVWRNQRTRWMKGWMQTLLVHLRQPRRLLADLGPRGTAVFLVLFAGMLLSALVQPVSLLLVALGAARLTAGQTLGALPLALLVLDLANILGAPLAFGLLAWRASPPAGRRGFARRVAATPAYWLLVGLATIRAGLQLARQPHRWEKTPHGAAARPRPLRAARARQIRRLRAEETAAP
jgi:glycosyltransferase XagB